MYQPTIAPATIPTAASSVFFAPYSIPSQYWKNLTYMSLSNFPPCAPQYFWYSSSVGLNVCYKYQDVHMTTMGSVKYLNVLNEGDTATYSQTIFHESTICEGVYVLIDYVYNLPCSDASIIYQQEQLVEYTSKQPFEYTSVSVEFTSVSTEISGQLQIEGVNFL